MYFILKIYKKKWQKLHRDCLWKCEKIHGRYVQESKKDNIQNPTNKFRLRGKAHIK